MKVGVIGSPALEAQLDREGRTQGLTVAQVAGAHEYGAGVPRRSWLRDWVDTNEKDLLARLERIVKRHLKTHGAFSLEDGLRTLGPLVQGELQENIVAGISPPNSPATIARKGSETPLVDTGQLKSSITWVLEGQTS